MRLRDEITVYSRTAGTAVGPYGDPVDVEDAGTTVPAYVEPADLTEDEINRQTRTNRYFVMVDGITVVDALSRIEWEGESYEVVGEPGPWKNHRGLHHYELQMRRTEG